MASKIFRPLKFGKETFHATSYDEQSFVMNYLLESGGAVPPHVHKHMDEHFLVKRGVMTFTVAGKKIMKQQGEDVFVPKGVTHAIKNAGTDQVEMVVTYSPCADTHRMFEIIVALDAENPGSMMNMVKYFYLAPRLGLKEFSSPRPAFVMHILTFIVTVMGKLSGWDKLIAKFR